MKKMRTIIAAVLACATALSFTGCGNAKRLQDEDFFYDALDKGAKIDDDDCYHEKNAYVNGDKVEYMIYSHDGDNFYTYLRFKDADDAMDYFEDSFYDSFEEALDDDAFEGYHKASVSRNAATVVFNGELEDSTPLYFYGSSFYFYSDAEFYGGVYLVNNVYIEVFSVEGSKRDKEKIDNVIKNLGFPKPQS
ncbi:MAG: hypothetical protein IJL19_07585 [Clostridiales bacterium]|nr:hypothetical protein [Clostridiales bacterium]